MGEIDRQRISAVKTLQQLGLSWHNGAWHPVSDDDLVAEADAMHAHLVCRADELVGCTDGSPEAAELAAMNPVRPLGWGSAENGKAGVEEAGTHSGHAGDLARSQRAAQCNARLETFGSP